MKFSADVRNTVQGIVIFVIVAVYAAVAIALAQDAPTQNGTPTVETLSASEEAQLENRFLKLEAAARDASPEALGKAIADFITQRQAAVQKANQDFGAYVQTLAKDGYDITRDPATGKFSRVVKAK